MPLPDAGSGPPSATLRRRSSTVGPPAIASSIRRSQITNGHPQARARPPPCVAAAHASTKVDPTDAGASGSFAGPSAPDQQAFYGDVAGQVRVICAAISGFAIGNHQSPYPRVLIRPVDFIYFNNSAHLLCPGSRFSYGSIWAFAWGYKCTTISSSNLP